MTKEEMNQIIKDSLVRNLRKENDIPANIGNIYKNWVISKIKAASAQLQEPTQPEQPEQPAQPEQQANGEQQSA